MSSDQQRSPGKLASWYSRTAKAAGSVWSAAGVFDCDRPFVVVWPACGPVFQFSDTRQLVIHQYHDYHVLMVFLIQNTQNRDTRAMQVKLDELIRVTQGAHNALLDLEELGEDELDAFRNKYQKLARSARADLGTEDTGSPEP